MREGVAALLNAEPDVVVIAVVEKVEDLVDVAGHADAIVCADAVRLPLRLSAQVFRLTDEAPAVLLYRLRHDEHEPVRPPHRLTPRETQIMRGVANGLSTAQLSELLGISQKSVENNKQRIFMKLGVQSQGHAVVVSHAAGLLDRAESSA